MDEKEKKFRAKQRARRSTVAKLREILKNAPDDALVVVLAGDHRYRTSTAHLYTAREGLRGNLSEDYDGPLEDGEERIPVLILGH